MDGWINGTNRQIDGSLIHYIHILQGNVILTDHSYTILSLLRVRTDNDTDVKFAIRESFSMETIKQEQPLPDIDQYVLWIEELNDPLSPSFSVSLPHSVSPSLCFSLSPSFSFSPLSVSSLSCRVKSIFSAAKPGDQLKHLLNPHFGKYAYHISLIPRRDWEWD